MTCVAERWTRQRRLEHTRGVLLDAAEEVFAKRGFGGAALEDIAEAAGYTRGAIYSHFGTKEELFLAAIERHLLRFLNGFEDIIGAFESLDDLNVGQFAERWRELTIAGPDSAALGYEFSLFLLRNPGARERLAAKREETIRSLADYIASNIARLGGTLTISAEALARVLIASHEGVSISTHLDGKDLYEPFLQMVMSNVAPKPALKSAPVKRPRARRTG
jgi:AcrR family transcriptional regulator